MSLRRRSGSTPGTLSIICRAGMSPCSIVKPSQPGHTPRYWLTKGAWACMSCSLEHLHGNAVACKRDVPVPIPSQVAEPPARRQFGVMERRLAQDPDGSLWHHVLATQNLQQCGLSSPIASQQQAPRPPRQGHGHVLHHWCDTRQRPSICDCKHKDDLYKSLCWLPSHNTVPKTSVEGRAMCEALQAHYEK